MVHIPKIQFFRKRRCFKMRLNFSVSIRPQLPDPPDIDDFIFEDEGNHSDK